MTNKKNISMQLKMTRAFDIDFAMKSSFFARRWPHLLIGSAKKMPSYLIALLKKKAYFKYYDAENGNIVKKYESPSERLYGMFLFLRDGKIVTSFLKVW